MRQTEQAEICDEREGTLLVGLAILIISRRYSLTSRC